MPKFTDKKGRVWDLDLDLLGCRRIDASDFTEHYSTKWSILQLDQPTLQALITKTSLTFAVIWALVKPQSETIPAFSSLTDEESQLEFISGINSQAKKDGHAAFLEALGDFFPEFKTGLSIANQQLRNLNKKYEDKMGSEIAPLLEEMLDQDMDEGVKQVRERLLKTRGERLGEMSLSLHQ